MKSSVTKSNPPEKLPIHFKTQGRSYSQIGRKGNVALYSVYSDYFILPDFALPYLLIGYELIVIKTKPNGDERYPRAEEFGHSAFAISKASKSFGRISSRLRGRERHQCSSTAFKTLPNRSPTSEACSPVAALAASQYSITRTQTDQTPTKTPPIRHRRVTLLGKNQICNLSEGRGRVDDPRGWGRATGFGAGKNIF